MSGAISNVQYGNPIAHAGVAEFAGSLKAELPPGSAWSGLNMAALMQGMAAAFADLHASAAQLSEVETLPWLTTELLPYWEADYGLPDCCTPLGSTLQQRRNTLLAKIAQVGGQSAAYFIAVAKALGWTITVTPGAAGTYAWAINAASTAPGTLFRAGGSRAGDYLQTTGTNAELECVMNQIKPAHSVLTFHYS